MGLFDDERLTRLTISVTQAQTAQAGRACHAVSAAIDQEQAAAETTLPEAQADRREAARLAGQT